VGLSGSPPPLSLAVSGVDCGTLPSATVPPLTCANRVHPLVRFAPLQSTPVAGLPQTLKPKAPPLGFAIPLCDICHPRLTPRAILICSVPCRPRRFSRPRRFPPRLALQVYFTPLPHPGFSLQGFYSSTAAVSAFTDRLPSRRCPDSANGSCPPSPLRRASPSGLCSASESVTQYPGISRVPSPIPLLSLSSYRCSPHCLYRCLHTGSRS